jgi:hypothetical protein
MGTVNLKGNKYIAEMFYLVKKVNLRLLRLTPDNDENPNFGSVFFSSQKIIGLSLQLL